MKRVVMAVNDTPERDAHDFAVVYVGDGESDESAFARAAEHYEGYEFYIEEHEEEMDAAINYFEELMKDVGKYFNEVPATTVTQQVNRDTFIEKCQWSIDTLKRVNVSMREENEIPLSGYFL